ncbi:MAG: hypothetical protein QOJ02_414 [Acidobacteriota bacterium]|jgi:hypothetical protein|nr:hypothetical protein [Acidobacteriota bacterium]
MPYFAPGSSGLTVAPPLPPAPAVVDKLAELSVDEPLPETYAANRIRLLAQSPRKLFLYWEFARNPFETLSRAYVSQADSYTLVVKLVELESGAETLHLASPTRSQWLDARPGSSYRADVGFYAEGRNFIRLLSSGTVHTPRAGVSRRTDTEPEFRVASAEFARVLDDAGYVSDALEVAIEAADGVTGDAATRTIASRFGGRAAPSMSDEDMIEMRGLLAALALGANINELQMALSARLADWLDEVSREHREAIDAAHLLEVLRAVLGIEMDPTAFAFLNEEAMHRTARVIVGASEVRLPLKPFHLWMPSMSPSLLERMNDESRIQNPEVRIQNTKAENRF